MSDDDDDEREHGRRRHSSGGGVGRWVMIAGWVLAAVLAGNLIIGKFRAGDAGRPSGFLTDELALAAAFWLPVVVLVGAAILGIGWAMKTHARREKASLLWMRNAFAFGAVSALLLILAAQSEKIFPRPWLAVWCAVLAAAQMSLFAYAAFREYRRTVGHGGGRRGGSSSGEGE